MENVSSYLTLILSQTRFANGTLDAAQDALASAKVQVYERLLAAITHSGQASEGVQKRVLAKIQGGSLHSDSTPQPTQRSAEELTHNTRRLQLLLERSLKQTERELALAVSHKTTPALHTNRSYFLPEKTKRVSPIPLTDVKQQIQLHTSFLEDGRRAFIKNLSLKQLPSQHNGRHQQEDSLVKQVQIQQLGSNYRQQTTRTPRLDPLKSVKPYTKVTPMKSRRLELPNRSAGSLKPDSRSAVNYLTKQRKQRESKERQMLQRLDGTSASAEYLSKRPWVLQSLSNPFNPHIIKAEESLNSQLIEAVRHKLKQLPQSGVLDNS